MKKGDVTFHYEYNSRTPKIEELNGVWRVKMWGFWRFMRRDKKVVSNGKGYNIYYLARCIRIRWGAFDVVQMDNCLRLVYKNGAIVDRLRIYSKHNCIMLGKFKSIIDGKNTGRGKPFTLTLEAQHDH